MTPLGLTKNTWPVALMRPMIWLASPPTTRLSVTEEADGWTKLTLASEPTLKLFQSMAARLLLWFTVSVLLLLLIDALPPTSLPPAGRALAGGVVCAHAAALHRQATASATVL
jgi:hypothetical protein